MLRLPPLSRMGAEAISDNTWRVPFRALDLPDEIRKWLGHFPRKVAKDQPDAMISLLWHS
jgi:hypothetical protein